MWRLRENHADEELEGDERSDRMARNIHEGFGILNDSSQSLNEDFRRLGRTNIVLLSLTFQLLVWAVQL